MGLTKDLFISMTQGMIEGMNIEKEIQGRMLDDEYQYLIHKKNKRLTNKKNKKK